MSAKFKALDIVQYRGKARVVDYVDDSDNDDTSEGEEYEGPRTVEYKLDGGEWVQESELTPDPRFAKAANTRRGEL